MPFKGQRIKSWKFCKYAYKRFQGGYKEGESGTIFGKFILRNILTILAMRNVNFYIKGGGDLVQLDYACSLNALQ